MPRRSNIWLPLLIVNLVGLAPSAVAGTDVLSSTAACDDDLTRRTAAPAAFKVAQLNAENLFLNVRSPLTEPFHHLSEPDWQRLAPLGRDNKPLAKTLALARSLREIDADLVMLNEVGGLESLENFSRHFLDDAYDSFLIKGNSPRDIEVGYLVRKKLGVRVELRTHKHRPLNFLYPFEIKLNAEYAVNSPEKIRPSQCFARDCAELRLYAPGAERPSLISLLVHLKATLDPAKIDPGGILRRGAEAKALMEIYRETRAEFSPPVPTMVAGDFNGHARTTARYPEFESMADVDLQSVTELAGLKGEAATTHVQGWMANDGQEIDFIFVSPDLAGRLRTTEIHRYRDEHGVPRPLPRTRDQWRDQASDHYPVVATFDDPFTSVAETQSAVKDSDDT